MGGRLYAQLDMSREVPLAAASFVEHYISTQPGGSRRGIINAAWTAGKLTPEVLALLSRAPPSQPAASCSPRVLEARAGQLLAVIGIFTQGTASGLARRHVLRASAYGAIGAPFVLPTANWSAYEREADEEGDLVLMSPGAASASPVYAEVMEAFAWLGCAITAFPRAAFIGQSRDDYWLRWPMWEALLSGVQAALQQSPLRSMRGALVAHWDSCSWRGGMEAPPDAGNLRGCINWPTLKPCARPNASADGLSGPFSFPRGPYFASRALLSAVVEAQRPALAPLREALEAPPRLEGAVRPPRVRPDAWLGFVLSQLPTLGPTMLACACVAKWPAQQVRQLLLERLR